MKKSWSKPKLIVLFRGKPEESVLSGCKDSTGSTTEQTAAHTDCSGVPATACGDCKDLGS